MPAALREGFTTGTAATAAAGAAVCRLLGKRVSESLRVPLPPFYLGEAGVLPEKEHTLAIPIERSGVLPCGIAWASVIKDGGDDPDATHGARLVAHASRIAFEASAPVYPPSGEPDFALIEHALRTAYPSPAIRLPGLHNPVFLYCGLGIGSATLPGLPVPVGEGAVNPVPRSQIAAAVGMAAREAGYAGPLHILLSVPDGEERARHTLNSRLGILGGISILGTSGIVRPYSHDAWKCAIAQGIKVAGALGISELLMSTGRRSERLGFALYPFLRPQSGIQVADYAAFSLREAGPRSFGQIFWVCFPGKLLKLAQGLEWTHAKAGDTDMPMLGRLSREAGADEELARRVEAMPTAAGAFAILEEAGSQLHDAVLLQLAGKAFSKLRQWLDEAQCDSSRKTSLCLSVFSLEEKLLLRMDDDGNLQIRPES